MVKELSDAQGIVSIVMVRQQGAILPQLSPLLVHEMKQTPQVLFVDMVAHLAHMEGEIISLVTPVLEIF